jgi:hypothetical protein
MLMYFKSCLDPSCSKSRRHCLDFFACFSIPKIKEEIYFLYTPVLCIYIYIINGIPYNTCLYLRTFPLLLKRTFHCACDSNKKDIETIMLSAFLNGKTSPNSHEVGEKIREGRIVPIVLTNC